MEGKGRSLAAAADITPSLKKLSLNPPAQPASVPGTSAYRSSSFTKITPRSLVSLCLGVLGRYFDDIIGDLTEISSIFPSDIKMALAALARRRKLLNDDVLIALADNSWELLDISGSAVTDFGLAKVSGVCKNLRAVDISRCDKITVMGVSNLMHQCRLVETLRCGGSPGSESTARRCLSIFKPNLKNIEGESWEELDSMDISSGSQSLRWLVWPKIDEDSQQSLAIECPRIVVNPQPLPFVIRGVQVPREALPGISLDDPIVEDIDPKTWAVSGFDRRNRSLPLTDTKLDTTDELPMAERFRLAFVERDMRLAPKRAKNARQHRRRAEREWFMNSTDAKSVALAFHANKNLHYRS